MLNEMQVSDSFRMEMFPNRLCEMGRKRIPLKWKDEITKFNMGDDRISGRYK